MIDPACSTGCFLHTIKQKYPNCITIGHDISQEMVRYSSKYVDESYCCDANDSPVEKDSIDLIILRFLNGGVVNSIEALNFLKLLLSKVRQDGYAICIGHTPILVKRTDFIKENFDVIENIGYEEKSDSVFQYYLTKKRRF